jgi:uncharacterized repeat protein (TIGR01451 family)
MTYRFSQAGPHTLPAEGLDLFSGRTFVGRKKCPDPALPGRMTTHKHRKGTTVKPTEQFANTASTPKTGLFASLRGLLHAKGSGLSKISYSQAGPDSLTADGPAKSGRPEENSGSCAGAFKITRGSGVPKSIPGDAARRYLLTTLVTLCAATAALLCSSAPALATDTPAPGWEVSGYTGPTVMVPGSTGKVWFVVNNTGAAENTGGVVTDTLPAGLRATGVKLPAFG